MHVLTIGDSITRYQFLDLVCALHTGRATPVPEKLVWEHLHTTWAAFYEHTTNAFGGHMTCDCYRSLDVPCKTPSACVENRYYKHPTAPLWLTHLQLFGDVPMTARVPLNESREARITSSVGKLYYATDVITVLREHVPYMDPLPTHVVINVGMWDHHVLSSRAAELVSEVLSRVTPRLVWKATSPPRYPSTVLPTPFALAAWTQLQHPARSMDLLMRDNYCVGRRCEYFEFPGPQIRAQREYYDDVHFKAATYRQWNIALWDRLMASPAS